MCQAYARPLVKGINAGVAAFLARLTARAVEDSSRRTRPWRSTELQQSAIDARASTTGSTVCPPVDARAADGAAATQMPGDGSHVGRCLLPPAPPAPPVRQQFDDRTRQVQSGTTRTKPPSCRRSNRASIRRRRPAWLAGRRHRQQPRQCRRQRCIAFPHRAKRRIRSVVRTAEIAASKRRTPLIVAGVAAHACLHVAPAVEAMPGGTIRGPGSYWTMPQPAWSDMRRDPEPCRISNVKWSAYEESAEDSPISSTR